MHWSLFYNFSVVIKLSASYHLQSGLFLVRWIYLEETYSKYGKSRWSILFKNFFTLEKFNKNNKWKGFIDEHNDFVIWIFRFVIPRRLGFAMLTILISGFVIHQKQASSFVIFQRNPSDNCSIVQLLNCFFLFPNLQRDEHCCHKYQRNWRFLANTM